MNIENKRKFIVDTVILAAKQNDNILSFSTLKGLLFGLINEESDRKLIFEELHKYFTKNTDNPNNYFVLNEAGENYIYVKYNAIKKMFNCAIFNINKLKELGYTTDISHT